jgi:hypothetical protein
MRENKGIIKGILNFICAHVPTVAGVHAQISGTAFIVISGLLCPFDIDAALAL